MSLQDQVALVTGAAHRVGRAIALELARRGAHIALHFHQSETQARQTAEEIRALGVRALAVRADLTQPSQLDALFGAVAAEFGALDALVNSASIMESGDARTLTRADWDRSLNLNLTAPFFCAQRAARLMQARGGVIVNIADGSAFRPWAVRPAHSVSKAGLVMLTQVLAKALAPAIRVNAVAPGPVMKPEAWDEAQWQRAASRTLLKRAGSGYDVARAVAFLIQEDFITGETLIVDGGERLG